MRYKYFYVNNVMHRLRQECKVMIASFKTCTVSTWLIDINTVILLLQQQGSKVKQEKVKRLNSVNKYTVNIPGVYGTVKYNPYSSTCCHKNMIYRAIFAIQTEHLMSMILSMVYYL